MLKKSETGDRLQKMRWQNDGLCGKLRKTKRHDGDETMKTGLVLEGGGMRGIYVAGVLDVFMEHALCFDGVIGNSAGAIHGCSYMS